MVIDRMKIVFCAFMLLFAQSSIVQAGDLIDEIKKAKSALGIAEIGVAAYAPDTGEIWKHAGNQPFPFMSTFKTLACAKLLKDAEQGKLSLETKVSVAKDMIVSWSPITEKIVGQTISLHEACSATMMMSDNTAANIVLEAIGGPEALTAFLREIGDEVSRLDRMETSLNEAGPNDPRDTTTPVAMVKNLNKLLYGDTLSAESRHQLKQWMMDNKVSDSLLRSVLPDGWLIADRSGAGGYGSRGITASLWNKEGKPFLLAIYLTQTEASFAERNKVIAQLGKEILKRYQNDSLYK